jgi:hypothetical protein
LEASVTTLRDEFLDVCRAGGPLDFLGPFLDVIKSPETSGRLTAAALQGVQRMLECDLIGQWGAGGMAGADGALPSRAEDVAAGVRMIAEAVTQCKFESSRDGSRRVRSGSHFGRFCGAGQIAPGEFLRHEDVTAVFQACYRIGHMRTDRESTHRRF